jgi:hypothetical protein
VPRPSNRSLILLAVILALLGSAWAYSMRRPDLPPAPTGLFTSLPILWNESDQLGDLLRSDQPGHWAREELTMRGRIVPLDTLESLRPDLNRLVIAQPRPIAPAENVALDNWVRRGGRLVLLADPALTAQSAFAVGDPRRPQDMVLLSPILARWGLELTVDEQDEEGVRQMVDGQLVIPVNLPGRWRLGAGADCQLAASATLADCRVGAGRVLALADAHLLDPAESSELHRQAFAELLDRGFSDR